MNKQQSRAVLIGTLVCLLFAAAAWFLVISPSRTKAAEAHAAAVTDEQATANLRAQAGELTVKKEQMPAAEAEYARLVSQFPSDLNTSAFNRMMEKSAGARGITITELTLDLPTAPQTVDPTLAGAVPAPAPAPGAPAAPAPAVDPATGAPVAAPTSLAVSVVKLTASGSAENIRNFLADLGTLDRPVFVQSAALATNDSGQTVLTVLGATYLLAPLNNPLEVTQTPEAPEMTSPDTGPDTTDPNLPVTPDGAPATAPASPATPEAPETAPASPTP